MKKLTFLALACVFTSSTIFAGIVNIRFANPELSGNNYCATVQIKAQDINFEIGSATVFFSYNQKAIQNPSFAPLNFNETNNCSGNSGAYKNSFNSLELNQKGEGNYAILLNEANQGCPTVSEEWIDVAQFCFQVVNPSEPVDLQFNTEYTAFNTVDNTGEQIIIGNAQGINNTVTNIEIVSSNSGIKIFPNITDSKVNIEYTTEKSGTVLVKVFDMLGQEVYKNSRNTEKGKFSHNINLAKYANGYYIVEVDNGTKKVSEKVLLAK